MIAARLTVGAVVLCGRHYGVVLEIDADRAVVAPVRRAPHPLLRGDVMVDPIDLGMPGSSGPDLAVRCGAAKLVPTAGHVTFGRVSSEMLLTLRQATVRAEASKSADSQGAARLRTVAIEHCFASRGRMVGRQFA